MINLINFIGKISFSLIENLEETPPKPHLFVSLPLQSSLGYLFKFINNYLVTNRKLILWLVFSIFFLCIIKIPLSHGLIISVLLIAFVKLLFNKVYMHLKNGEVSFSYYDFLSYFFLLSLALLFVYVNVRVLDFIASLLYALIEWENFKIPLVGSHVSRTTKPVSNLFLSAPGPQQSVTGSQGLSNEGTAQSLARADTVGLDPQVIHLDSSVLDDNPSKRTNYALWDANAEQKLILIENQYLIGLLKVIIILHTTPEGKNISSMVDTNLKKFLSHLINVNIDRHGLNISKVKLSTGIFNTEQTRDIFKLAFENLKANLNQNVGDLSDVFYTRKRWLEASLYELIKSDSIPMRHCVENPVALGILSNISWPNPHKVTYNSEVTKSLILSEIYKLNGGKIKW